MYRTEEFTILQAEQGGPANDTQFSYASQFTILYWNSELLHSTDDDWTYKVLDIMFVCV